MGNWDSLVANRKLMKDFSERTLAHVPTEFGKLTYLTSLRDLGSGRYSHAGLEALFPEKAVQETLLHVHREIFMRVLEMPLEKQEPDLALCLRAFEGDLLETIRLWRELEFYRSMIPSGLPHYVMKLFCSNVMTLLGILETDAVKFQEAA